MIARASSDSEPQNETGVPGRSLMIDSLDVVEIMFEIEDRFRIRLPQNSKAMQDATVRDLVAWVGDEVAKKAEA